MRRNWSGLAALLCASFGLSSITFAGDEGDDRLRAMEDRLRALEARLAESESVIESQRELLRNQAPDVAQGDELDAFLSSIEIGGHVATSYVYSFNNPATNTFSQTLCQFNCNHNEFSLDAIKLELGKPLSEPGSVGFQFDLLFGQNASIFKALSPDGAASGNADGTSDTEFFVQQAYLSYQYNDIELKFGKFETLLGYELIDGNDNPNVTQGILFTFAIPLFHTGFLASGSLSEEVSWSAGLVNGFNNTLDTGDNKGFLGQLAWEDGPWFASLSTYVGTLGETRASLSTPAGSRPGDNSVQTQIYDAILQYSPSEDTTAWLNIDWGKTDVSSDSNGGGPGGAAGSDPHFFGLAAGIKQQLSEKMFVAFRGEYMNDDQGSRFSGLVTGNTILSANNPNFVGGNSFDEIDAWSTTLTLGYQVTPSLLARVEYRRDQVDCDKLDCSFFRDSSDGGEETNDLGIIELIYSFD